MSRFALLLPFLFTASAALAADAPSTPAAARPKANYELAAQWSPVKVGKLVFDLAVTPHWLEEGDRFWYSFETSRGRRFWMIDPVKKTRSNVFDPVKLAAALTGATGIPYDSQHLPITTIHFVKSDSTIQFDLSVPRDAVIPGEKKVEAQNITDNQEPQQQGGRGGRGGAAASRTEKTLSFEYELAGGKLTLLPERPARKPQWASISPDEKTVIFARNHNLYMMDAANYAKALKNPNDKSIVETQLTKDGEEDFGYGGRGMGGFDQQQQQQQQQQQEENDQQGQQQDNKNARTAVGNLAWSRDSKKFALVRRDARKVEKLWVINALANPRPTLETYAYAMPGDANIPQPQLEIFDVAAQSRTVLKTDLWKDQSVQIEVERPSARARDHDHTEALWAGPGSGKLYFTRMSRDLHRVDLCVADLATGESKPLIQERMNVYIETKPLRVTSAGELIWWSERDGWGHYYLYDGAGALKNQITHGEFVAEDVSWVDEKGRALYLTASGHEDGENPYNMHFYRANLDGSGMKVLDAGDGSHAVNMADSGRFFVDTGSRVDTAPKSALYDAQGGMAMPLETVDTAPLTAAGFKFPEPFTVKADDGVTDLYGVMYKPFDFDPAKKYPVIEYVYPGPQTEQVTQVFTPLRNDRLMLANFGFIVIEVGNRGGNPHRSKWYHTYGYGNLRDYGLADKKRAIEELAARYPFMDIERVGIWGHSGGGFMTAAAMLIYPDFFKVGVSESGNHENNVYNNTWSEKHHGLKEVTGKDGNVTFEYSIDKNSELAKNLKGHLLLSTGDIDNNVHPSNTYRLADALIRANKRFDMIVLPGQRHGYTTDADYFRWVRADYFCKYLLGDFDQSVDMWELNRERQENNKTPGGQQQGGQQRRATTGGADF